MPLTSSDIRAPRLAASDVIDLIVQEQAAPTPVSVPPATPAPSMASQLSVEAPRPVQPEAGPPPSAPSAPLAPQPPTPFQPQVQSAPQVQAPSTAAIKWEIELLHRTQCLHSSVATILKSHKCLSHARMHPASASVEAVNQHHAASFPLGKNADN